MALCLCSFLASQTSCLSWVLAWGGAWRRTPSVMNHSSTLGGVAMGLSREEKHLPDSQVPQPQETTALEGGDEQTIWGGQQNCLNCHVALELSPSFSGPQIPQP